MLSSSISSRRKAQHSSLISLGLWPPCYPLFVLVHDPFGLHSIGLLENQIVNKANVPSRFAIELARSELQICASHNSRNETLSDIIRRLLVMIAMILDHPERTIAGGRSDLLRSMVVGWS